MNAPAGLITITQKQPQKQNQQVLQPKNQQKETNLMGDVGGEGEKGVRVRD